MTRLQIYIGSSSSSNYCGWQLSLAAVVVWMGSTLL